MTYAGQPAITYFFASSGGMTESVQNAFPGSAPEPWLLGVPDPFDSGPLHSWSTSLGFAAAAAATCTGSCAALSRHRSAQARRLAAHPLRRRARLQGSTTVSGDELAARLGLYDTWAYFSVSGPHGVQSEPDRSGAPAATSPPPTTLPNGGTP